MGREFLDLFESWADSYDNTVIGNDKEYKDVFFNYDQILDEVATHSYGHVVEFGSGTGNLTKKLLERGLRVTAIEPVPAMRKIAQQKLGKQSAIIEGDFLDFPEIVNVDTIVSTYAFHHLTDEEKEQAIGYYGKLLSKGGKIVFADTMYQSVKDYQTAIVKAKNEGFHNLANDLATEYYTTIPYLKNILEANGFTAAFRQCNDFVWLMEGIKQ